MIITNKWKFHLIFCSLFDSIYFHFCEHSESAYKPYYGLFFFDEHNRSMLDYQLSRVFCPNTTGVHDGRWFSTSVPSVFSSFCTFYDYIRIIHILKLAERNPAKKKLVQDFLHFHFPLVFGPKNKIKIKLSMDWTVQFCSRNY